MRDPRGFTLLEILVALAILSGTLVLAFRVVSGGIEAQARSEQWLSATLLGEAELRRATASFPAPGDTEGRFPPPDERFRWRKRVTQAMHRDAREVHLTVAWDGEGGEERVDLSGLAVK
jgi:general secretion pathway protein I